MEESKRVKDAIFQLTENLGTIGQFMLGEVRAFLRKSRGATREEFMAAVDQIARSMKQSGKLAIGDIERAASEIKKNWKLLDDERKLEWETFLTEVKSRLQKIGEVSQDTFNIAVDHAKKTIDKQWSATGRVGEEQVKAFQENTEKMAEALRGQWSVFRETMERTGKKIDKAVHAAWEELRKKE